MRRRSPSSGRGAVEPGLLQVAKFARHAAEVDREVEETGTAFVENVFSASGTDEASFERWCMKEARKMRDGE